MLRMWTYDLAREQAPSLEHMRVFCEASLEGGYDAIGLYLEHRFAYPSTPWAHGLDCLTPEMVARLEGEFPSLQIIPFVNLLGHFEGMLYTEFGKRFREEQFQGMQACPSKPEFVELARGIIDDTIACFRSDIIHIGGDETWQLGKCPACASRVEGASSSEGCISTPLPAPLDGKAVLYGEHFGPLAQHVSDKGRRPAVWGDMYLEHPTALDFMPRETLIFDWQYFNSPLDTSRQFVEKGFDVVCCPTLHTYNAAWLHLEQSEENVRAAYKAASQLDAFGVCVTTWECCLFGNYETLLPAIKASGSLAAQANGPLPAWGMRGPVVEVTGDPRQLVFEPNDQISAQDLHEYDDGVSLIFQIAKTVVANALEGGYSLFLQTKGDVLAVQDASSLAEHGQLPLEQAAGLRRHLLLLANMSPIRRATNSQGEIRATYKGRAFSGRVEVIGDILGAPDLRVTWIALDEAEKESSATGGAFLRAYAEKSEQHGEWARLMGVELQVVGGVFGFSGTRSSLKVRLLLEANPFLAWLYHHEELTGEVGEKALAILDHAISVAPDSACRGVSEFVRGAVEFVRYAEQARQAYANGLPGVATSALAPCRQLFENMEKTAHANQIRIGGSRADIERCRVAREHVERVIRRIKEYGDDSLGYLPAFEHITHPKFVPHDQGAWWLINRWANE